MATAHSSFKDGTGMQRTLLILVTSMVLFGGANVSQPSSAPAPQPSPERRDEPRRNANANAPMGAVYGLGFLGALVYYIQTASSFWVGVLGVLKALLWPAFLVYELLRHLGA